METLYEYDVLNIKSHRTNKVNSGKQSFGLKRNM